ncbi:ABC transporter ATP-binding protein [Streptomyces sp. NBC_01456]|uniref:ABC transporter ATP-binding protein n=1 Tax=unclassified Streptomyces TaxID=2593676 RepID=UPI002E38087A|nr:MULTISPECIES: ABC transporter ATP-binding protein [unclassified Streptomyces]
MATDVHGPVTGIEHRRRPHPAGSGAAVEVDGLVRAFGDRVVIDGLELSVRTGEFVALLGRSGCGKSTLLRVLAGLDREITGEVLVPRRKAVAFQAPRLMPWKRVWRNVLLGLPGRPRREAAVRALTEVGLGHRADAWPKTLSGGEAQRASLARALVREPDLLLLDEPFGALDALTRLKAQRLVAELWQERGCAVLLVTHDVEEALLLADRVLVMEDGRIAYEATVDLARPRDISAPRFGALRARLLDRLGVEGAEVSEAGQEGSEAGEADARTRAQTAAPADVGVDADADAGQHPTPSAVPAPIPAPVPVPAPVPNTPHRPQNETDTP